jgi:hypothetical protein
MDRLIFLAQLLSLKVPLGVLLAPRLDAHILGEKGLRTKSFSDIYSCKAQPHLVGKSQPYFRNPEAQYFGLNSVRRRQLEISCVT